MHAYPRHKAVFERVMTKRKVVIYEGFGHFPEYNPVIAAQN